MPNAELAPIALFVYKRLSHTQRVLEAILKNPESAGSHLFVFSDAAKGPEEEVAVRELRTWLRQIKGFQKITIIERPQNLGLSSSLLSGIDEVLRHYEQVIVLEDDIVTSPRFLEFCNKGLNTFKDQEKVSSISGYLYPLANFPSTPFFLRFPECWGWATWKRAWNHFERDPAKLAKALKSKGLTKHFDFGGTYPYFDMLEKQVRGEGKSWAVRWAAHCVLDNKLTLYPPQSLVQNIGFDGSGENCGSEDVYSSSLAEKDIAGMENFDRLVLQEDASMRKEFEAYFRKIIPAAPPTLLRRIKNKIKRFI